MAGISKAERERRAALIAEGGQVEPLADDDGDDGDAQPGVELVLMVRDGATADVHPFEVANYAAGGWLRA